MPSPENLYAVVAKYEPRIRAALGEMLASLPKKANLTTITAFITKGDLTGLQTYITALYMGAAPPFLAVLRETMTAAGIAVEADILAAATRLTALNARAVAAGRPPPHAVPTLNVPLPAGTTGVVFQGAEGFRYNPVNPKTVAATRTWQGNLIQQMSQGAREGVMDKVRDGILRGENPRQTAIKIREGLNLTRSQQASVGNFANEIDDIIANGMRSAQSWGLYTPKQIAALKINDPAAYRDLNFTATEIKSGRRWGKISRAGGTLQQGQKPIGFTAPPSTQGGENAYRLIPGTDRPVDRMTKWRLRDKTLDPLIYDVIKAREAGDEAAEAAARRKLKAKSDLVKQRYQERYVKHRSQVIARTEALRAANLGSYESWRQAVEDSDLFDEGQVRKRWVTAKDDRVRPDHRNAAGQTQLLQDPFLVAGTPVMFPPHQPNCRCSLQYVVDLSP